MLYEELAVIILAAGKGTRMQSDIAKVLHEINGRPMLHYVMDAARTVAGNNLVVVVGHQHRTVRDKALENGSAVFALQHRQNGTGDAVMVGMAALPPQAQRVLILYGDVPLITSNTLTALIDDHLDKGAHVSVLGVKQKDPTGYGRIILQDGIPMGIVEEKDADDAQKKLDIVNSGIYVVEIGALYTILPMIESNNAQNEVYLTDIVAIAQNMDLKTNMFVGSNPREVLGVNTIEELNSLQN